MPDEVDQVLAVVADWLEPGDEERAALASAVAHLLDRVEAAIDELGVDAEVIHVGSTARDTWMRGERDIDIFVRFPVDIGRERLASSGLDIGRAVLADGRAHYAEHPYISGSHEGFDVDIVPCFDVADASEARSAVDRTPFHNAYVAARLTDELAREVRLAKAFTSAIGIYGSNLRTRGFGGYLLELLVLEYGSFRALLEAAADWQPPVELDPEGHGQGGFDDDLVVIDPTDPDRNVAAVVTTTSRARLQHHARAFLADPTTAAFEPTDPERLSSDDFDAALEARGTTALALVFDRPDLIDDQLFPQLRKTHEGIVDGLDRHGFDVLRSTHLASQDSLAILVECEVDRRPHVERHAGPPVHLREHAERFLDAYVEADVYGPFIDDGRYAIERERAFTTPREYLESDALLDVRLGDHLEPVLEAGYDVYAGDELVALLDDFQAGLAAYVDPSP
ncbi:MAG: CCA tRNA nucleotidyltransferase [Halobacteriota archaeon]